MHVIIQCCLLFIWLNTLNSVNAAEMNCYSGNGRNYRGTVSRTISGKTCQRWSVKIPHNHDRTPEEFPCRGLDNNYCRNPDNERMPWCYTTDPQTRWEYCQIPTCVGVPEPEPSIVPELSCFTCDGANYRGTVARTITGKTCQRWSAQTPHSHTRTPERFPNKGLDSNYCRNPYNERRPWCYTTDPEKRWEYCDVPRCSIHVPDPVPVVSALKQTTVTEMTCYSGIGTNYRGTVARTVSGKTCQSWTAQTPHSHQRTPQNYPCKDLNNNYCRNPDNERMPWCYTTDSQARWEYCQIPKCDGVPEPEPIVQELTCFTCEGGNYRGTVARTISGKTCQRWSEQEPHRHGRTPQNHPQNGLDSNYCRNPDNEMKPWCYTTDPQTRWEYCDVPRCVVPNSGVPKPALLPLQFSGCGKTRPKLFSLLVTGGERSIRGEHPWQASLQWRTNGSPLQHRCGGILIASCWVLTAAHCISWEMQDLQVVLGKMDLTINDDDVQTIPVKRTIMHGNYTEGGHGTAHNDVALLQLSVTDGSFCAKENIYVKTACLPEKRFPDGTKCTVSGWGLTDNSGSRMHKISYTAEISLMSNQECIAKFSGYPQVPTSHLDDSVICAGEHTCKGDSGGPLTCEEQGVHYITGVVSWGQDTCGGPLSVPGVFANVHKYVDWIKENWLS